MKKHRIMSLVLSATLISGTAGSVFANPKTIPNKPYINGYEDGTFKPKNNVRRSEIAKMISTIRELSATSVNFGDVSVDYWASNYIGAVQNAGLVKGYQGNFKPEDNLTRAELATIVSRIIKIDNKEREKINGVNFTDISEHWAEEVIKDIANLGIINGYEDGTYRPEGKVTRGETVAMLNRMAERKIDPKILDKIENVFRDLDMTDWSTKDIVAASTEYRYSIGENGVEDIFVDTEKPVLEGNFKVSSASAINLNQIEIVFDTEVDKHSAELHSNYRLDGADLSPNDTVSLLEDGRTLLINLDTPMKSEDEKELLVVGESFYNEAQTGIVLEYTEKLVFSDTEVPTIKSVKVLGNRKLIVEFSETMKMNRIPITFFKIDDEFAANKGLGTVKILDATKNGKYSSRVELEFNADIPFGTYELSMTKGSQVNLVDAAGNVFEEDSASFSIPRSVSTPSIESIRAENNGLIEVEYDREMDSKTALNKNNYSIKGSRINDIEFKNSSGGKIVILRLSSLSEGEHTIEFKKEIEDSFGKKLGENNVEKSIEVIEDKSIPKVLGVANISEDTIRVVYNETVNDSTAKKISNYIVKNPLSEKVDIKSIASVGKHNTMYEIKFSKKLENGNYTINIANVSDVAKTKNTIVDEALTFQYSDMVTPKIVKDGVLKKSDREVEIRFNKKMDKTLLSDIANYRYKDGAGKVYALPKNTTITILDDGLGIKIKFPETYTIYSEENAAQAPKNDKSVLEIGVENLIDTIGNELGSGIYKIMNPQLVVGSSYVKDSLELKDSGDEKIEASFLLTEKVSGSATGVLYAEEFDVSGLTADKAVAVTNAKGNIVTLEFSNEASVKELRRRGKDVRLSLVGDAEKKNRTSSGGVIGLFTGEPTSKETVAPKLNKNGVLVSDEDNKIVTLTFSENITADSNFIDANEYFEIVYKEAGVEKVNKILKKEIVGNVLILETEKSISTEDVLKTKNKVAGSSGAAMIKDLSGNGYSPKVDLNITIRDSVSLIELGLVLSSENANPGGTFLTVDRKGSSAEIGYSVYRGAVKVQDWKSMGTAATTERIDNLYDGDRIEIGVKKDIEVIYHSDILVKEENIKLIEAKDLYTMEMDGASITIKAKANVNTDLIGGTIEYSSYHPETGWDTEWYTLGAAPTIELKGDIVLTSEDQASKINIRINDEGRPVKDGELNVQNSYLNQLFVKNTPTVEIKEADRIKLIDVTADCKLELSVDGVVFYTGELDANAVGNIGNTTRYITEDELKAAGILGDAEDLSSLGEKNFKLRYTVEKITSQSKTFELTIPAIVTP